MSRPYAGAATTHMVLGLICMAAGITWICMLFFYEPLFATINQELKPIPEILPAWVTVLLAAKIYCGFWFFLTGAVGCCIKTRGCTEGVFVALNVLNVIIWAPVLLLLMAAVTYGILIGLGAFITEDLSQFNEKFSALAWLWAFPGVGLFVGVIEFILSIVSYSIVCCCRPSQLNEGYEYQYEMK